MRYYGVMGQCTAFINKKLIEIGFKNIKSINRTPEGVHIITKHDGTKQRTYIVKVELIEEYIGPPKKS